MTTGVDSMSRIKLIALSAVAVFALSVMAASAAFGDAGQEFEAPVGIVTGTGGAGILTAGTNIVKCESNSSTAEGAAGHLKTNFDEVRIVFRGCKSEKTGCAATAIHSVGAIGPGEVVTKKLAAELAENRANDKPAILFEGVGAAEVFTELEKNACTVLTKVTGKEPCEIKENTRTTGEVICPTTPIAEVERSVGDAVVPNSLKAFSANATEQQTDTTVQEPNKLIPSL